MSSVMISYGGLAILMLRGALIHEIVAQRASRRRIEQELHLTLTRMLATMPSQTVTAGQTPDSTASMLTGHRRAYRSMTVASARGTGRIR
jgi:hypothetical protein